MNKSLKCVTNIKLQVETVDDWWGLAKLGQTKAGIPIFLDGDQILY